MIPPSITRRPSIRSFAVALAVSSLFAAFTFRCEASDNLIQKGDFESMDPTIEGRSEPVWTDAGDMATVRIVAAEDGSGKRLVFRRSQAKGGAWYWLIDRLPIVPGQRYYLSFDVRVGDSQARVNLQFREPSGGWVAQNDPASVPGDVSVDPSGVVLSIVNGGLTTVTVSPESVPNPAGFTKVGLTFTAPDAAATVRIALGMTLMEGAVEFDNVSLVML